LQPLPPRPRRRAGAPRWLRLDRQALRPRRPDRRLARPPAPSHRRGGGDRRRAPPCAAAPRRDRASGPARSRQRRRRRDRHRRAPGPRRGGELHRCPQGERAVTSRLARLCRLLPCLGALAALLLLALPAAAQSVTFDLGEAGGSSTGRIVQLMVLVTVLSLA